MVLYYRGAGLVANLALTIYVFLLLGLLAGLNAALTLPGIAGIILSVGMAVDANVIVFERIREELRLGKTVRSAVEGGFSRALRAILDANVTTLIAAGVLYKFGSDRIQGFAVTLSLGILASMFTAVVITRFLLRQLIRADLVRNTRFFFGV
jgi:protein-export membrane protein SecD